MEVGLQSVLDVLVAYFLNIFAFFNSDAHGMHLRSSLQASLCWASTAQNLCLLLKRTYVCIRAKQNGFSLIRYRYCYVNFPLSQSTEPVAPSVACWSTSATHAIRSFSGVDTACYTVCWPVVLRFCSPVLVEPGLFIKPNGKYGSSFEISGGPVDRSSVDGILLTIYTS